MSEGKEIAYLSLSEIFTKNRFFEIPDYQRGYTWEKEQVNDLIKDIESLMSNNIEHFTGTIVAVKRNKNIFEIVDGQQRLTSLVILIREIYDTDKIKYKDKMEKYVQTQKAGNEKLILKPNYESTEKFFTDCIVNDNTPVELENFSPHKNMMFAKKEFSSWLKNKNIDDVLNVIEEKLKFIFFTQKNTETISMMFEVINNRGKLLSELEKIKNYMIYLTALKKWKQTRKNINSQWKNILEHLSEAKIQTIEEENKFLGYCCIVYFSKNDPPFKELSQKFKHTDIENFISFLEKAAKNYKYFLRENFRNLDGNISDNMKEKIKYLKCHQANASIMPLYLAIMDKKEYNDKLNILSDLEKLNFRFYIMGVARRSDAHKGTLYSLAHRYFKNTNFSDKELKEEIKKIIINDTPLHMVVDKLSNIAEINWHENSKRQSIKYFLARYEKHLRKKTNQYFDVELILKSTRDQKGNLGDYLSLEHIWALENKSDVYGVNHPEKIRLGNFVLMGLPQNIKLKNYDIECKINKMQKCEAVSLRQEDDLQSYRDTVIDKIRKKAEERNKRIVKRRNYFSDFSKAINDLREKDLIEFAIETWALDDEELKEYKESNEYKNYLKSIE